MIKTTTSHAAPFIRYQLIHAAGQASCAKTKRDQIAGYREAFAYGKVLEIMLDAESTKGEPAGIFDFDSIPGQYVDAAKKFLGERQWAALGFEPQEA